MLHPASELAVLPRGCKVRVERTKCDSSSHAEFPCCPARCRGGLRCIDGKTVTIGAWEPWRGFDALRPNVPLVQTEDPGTLGVSFYHAFQVREFTRLETSAVNNAKCCALHFDVDGHVSNLLAASFRREELPKLTKRTPMVSARHWKSPSELSGQLRDGRGRLCRAAVSSEWEGTSCDCFTDFGLQLIDSWRHPSLDTLKRGVELHGCGMWNQHTFGDENDDAWSEIDDKRDEDNRERPIARRSSSANRDTAVHGRSSLTFTMDWSGRQIVG